MKKFYIGILSIVAAILICTPAVTASAADYSTQATNEAHGQVLDKDGNVLKDVPLKKDVETVQGKTVVADIVLLDDGSYTLLTVDETSENTETVQGDTITTDIVLLDDGSYIYVTEEIEEPAISTDAEWWEWFNTLTPDQQAKINFRPNRESGELLPQETTER